MHSSYFHATTSSNTAFGVHSIRKLGMFPVETFFSPFSQVYCFLRSRTRVVTSFNEIPLSLCSVSRFQYRILWSLSCFLRSSLYFRNRSKSPIFGSGAAVCSSEKHRICNILHERGWYAFWDGVVSMLRNYLVTFSSVHHISALLVCIILLSMSFCHGRDVCKTFTATAAARTPCSLPQSILFPCSTNFLPGAARDRKRLSPELWYRFCGAENCVETMLNFNAETTTVVTEYEVATQLRFSQLHNTVWNSVHWT